MTKIMPILVATHKDYAMPSDKFYQPIYVGSALHKKKINNFLSDATGDNISIKNPYYNELTALYWAKYNLQDQKIIGLAHYRRFLGHKASHQYQDILTEYEVNQALENFDVLVPKARNYWIENQEQHYLNAHSHEPWQILQKVIAEQFSDYQQAFKQVSASKKAHLFNMSIMKQTEFQAYTDFLFDVLSAVEKERDFTKLHDQDQRALGFLGERMLDVWLIKTNSTYQEFPMVSIEKINWITKGWHFLLRHFGLKHQAKTHF